MDSTQSSTDPYAHLRGVPERDIILQAVTQDDLPVPKAIEEIVKLTTAAAAPSSAQNALYMHAIHVSVTIHNLAMRIPHNQQSKLIDFVVRLQQVAVPDPSTGGIIQLENEDFWSDMPQMSLTLADYHYTGSSKGTAEEQSRNFENCTAYVAQLSEIGFSFYRESTDWNYSQLTRVLGPDQPTRSEIRIVCFWFIYAPNKVWLDVQAKDIDMFDNQNNGDDQRLLPEFWPKWKNLLQACQHNTTGQQLDEDTQELIRHALENIGRIEAERGS
ncbi:unnamed protein product [Clonostachys byssicola]|uniref:Uncharacterized protein n=1 Tax=Clonostachys byssicola TaxID=160290 RepID=A0A9N9UD32_9HYPO|nr:unnamed protein product [Clonostachys byssicola]